MPLPDKVEAPVSDPRFRRKSSRRSRPYTEHRFRPDNQNVGLLVSAASSPTFIQIALRIGEALWLRKIRPPHPLDIHARQRSARCTVGAIRRSDWTHRLYIHPRGPFSHSSKYELR